MDTDTSAMNLGKTSQRHLVSWRQYVCLATLAALLIVWALSSQQGLTQRWLTTRNPRPLSARGGTMRPARRPTRVAGRVVRPKPVRYRITHKACTILEFDPFDPSIKRHHHHNPNISWCHGKPNFLTIRNGFVDVLEEMLDKHSVLPKDLLCFYREMQRNQYSSEPDGVTFYGDRQPLLFDKPLKEEFVYVECATKQSPNRTFHKQYLLNAVIKKDVEERCSKTNRTTPHNLSVLVLGLDSMSYLHLERHLPETVNFVREELGAFELLGYNKVGDNAYPNQRALVTGLDFDETLKYAPNGFYDSLASRMIWQQYAERGYRTMLLEDWAKYGIFNQFAHGFRFPPTDYYPHNAIRAMENASKWITGNVRLPRCLGPKLLAEEMLEYATRFTQLMGERPFFAYFWVNEITHDDLNMAALADKPFRRLLGSLRSSGVLNRTVLVFVSDHGQRSGEARYSFIGKYEDRQPFAHVAFPKWFLEQNPKAARSLLANQVRLTTPYDVHATLVELLDYPSSERPLTAYGRSLLHEMPQARTCADAHIRPHWCICNVLGHVTVNTKMAWLMAEQVIHRVNKIMPQEPGKCARLRAHRVYDVTALEAATRTGEAQETSYYWVTVQALPRNGLFEGRSYMDSSAKIVGKISPRQLVLWRLYGCLVTLTALFVVWTLSSNQELSVQHPRPLRTRVWAMPTTPGPTRRRPTGVARRVMRPIPVGHRIRTEGCTIPEFNPFDPTIRRHHHRHPNISWCHGKPNFLTIRNGVVDVLEDKLDKHSVLPDDLLCFYREIQRNQYSSEPDGFAFYGDRQPLLFDKPLKEEFVFVECATKQSPNRIFHKQYLLNAVIKKDVEDRCSKTNRTTPHNLSVLVLGLDSMSYLHLERHLRETVKFVREKLMAFELRGYNKVGDNSYPNQRALVTGLDFDETLKYAPDGFYDSLASRMIWQQYAERGYRTMVLEDWAKHGIFNEFAHGFRFPPTDYYPHNAILAMEKASEWIMGNVRLPRCLGPKLLAEETLDYVTRFTQLMSERPFFAYIWVNEITHDNLNMAALADKPFRRLLESLRSSGVLNRTVLVFVSDHGTRYGKSRYSFIGKFEDRQPFAHVAFPKWFLEQNPKAARSLLANQLRLTTPYDVHATLVELLDYPSSERPHTAYGRSLLHEIPETRTCADAHIRPHWCACNVLGDVTVSKQMAWLMAEQVVYRLNKLVPQDPGKCAVLRPGAVYDVTALQAATRTGEAQEAAYYWVTVRVLPINSFYEASLCSQVPIRTPAGRSYMDPSAKNMGKNSRGQLVSWSQYGCLLTLVALFLVWTLSSDRELSARHPRPLRTRVWSTRATPRPTSRRPTSVARRVMRPIPVGHRIRTEGCTIPEFNPFDPTIRRHHHRNPNMSWCHGKPDFITIRHGVVDVLEDKLDKHSVLPNDLLCFYQELQRGQDSSEPDNFTIYGEQQPLLFGKPLKEEFVVVECATKQSPDRTFHKQYLLNAVIKEDAEERCSKTNRTTPHNLSVLVLGLDSLSYLHLERHLPETVKFVREELRAFELRGYNKVGDNSYPNQRALVTGLDFDETLKYAPDGFYDSLASRMIWQQYAERGYRTMLLEDWAEHGIFNEFAHGFRFPPTDYYPHNAIRAMEKASEWITGNDRLPRCLGPKLLAEEMLDYFTRFTQLMSERPFFAYIWVNEITHEDLNMAALADKPFRRLLESLRSSGVLNRTVLVFVSDHGTRFGESRYSFIGKFEDRQPFAHVAFPKWFLEQNPKATGSLLVNQLRLTTPYDVHATLVELLDYPSSERPHTAYGRSLLHEIPERRTCADAHIRPHWCACNVLRRCHRERGNGLVNGSAGCLSAEQVSAAGAGEVRPAPSSRRVRCDGVAGGDTDWGGARSRLLLGHRSSVAELWLFRGVRYVLEATA
ncbi:hypothetical protein MTO96_051697 [Rhipicephalus appendiculatus]